MNSKQEQKINEKMAELLAGLNTDQKALWVKWKNDAVESSLEATSYPKLNEAILLYSEEVFFPYLNARRMTKRTVKDVNSELKQTYKSLNTPTNINNPKITSELEELFEKKR